MLVLAIPMWAQKGNRITGKVVDENGEPLPGAVVMLNGQTSSAVETDLDGLFDIVASKDKNVLTKRYLLRPVLDKDLSWSLMKVRIVLMV